MNRNRRASLGRRKRLDRQRQARTEGARNALLPAGKPEGSWSNGQREVSWSPFPADGKPKGPTSEEEGPSSDSEPEEL